MKTILTVAVAGLWILIAFQACTKQELVTVNEPLKLNENSIQYQQYMEERAIELIKKYRFDQLGNTIDRIKDPAAKERVLALLTEYRDRAFNEALYYAKPNGDTIFFFPPNIDDRKEAKRLLIGNPYQKAAVNEIGVLHGLKNFPKVETLDIGNSLATGIKDLDGLPELKTFNWTFVPYYFGEFYPDVELAPVPLALDFSQNHKLETVNIEYVDLANLKFPATKIKSLGLRDAIINKGEEIDAISANALGLKGIYEQPNLVLTTKNIDSLLTDLNLVNLLDISATNILTLNTRNSEKIKLNNGLKKLILEAGNLKEKPVLSIGLEEATISDYKLSDRDFSSAASLKKISFHSTSFEGLVLPTSLEDVAFYIDRYNGSGAGINSNYSNLARLKRVHIEGGGFDQTGLVFPPSLEYLSFSDKASGYGNYSNLANLKEFESMGIELQRMPLFPSSLTKLSIYDLQLSENTTVDLSHLTNLNYLYLYTNSYYQKTPVTLILPANLSQEVLQHIWNVDGREGIIFLPTGSTIVNAPGWLEPYVVYL